METLEPRVVLTGQVPEVTIDGLVSWYRAEGNPNDTANGNNGAFVAGATTVAGGIVGQAFDFNATPRRVEIPNDSSLGLQTFTIDAWVNSIFPGSLGDDMGGGIIGKAFGSSLVSVAIMGPGKNGSNFSNGHFTFAVTTTDGIQQFQESFISPNYPINQWHHVAMRSNGTTIRGFVNGVMMPGAISLAGRSILNNPAIPWTIGGHPQPGPYGERYYQGKIDEVGFYQRGLSDVEVDSLFDQGSLGRYTIPAGQQFSLPGAFTDTDSATWTATVDYGVGPQTLSLNPNNTFSLAHVFSSVGQRTITVAITDDTGNTTPHSLIVNVTAATNTPPVANDDAWTVNEDQVLSVPVAGVLANDSDAELNPMTAVFVAGSGPSHGSLTLNADGSFTYTPVANYHGPDAFQYQASDGNLPLSNIATVNLTVDPVPDAPVLVAIGNRNAVEGTLLTFTATATDADTGPTLTFGLQGTPVPPGAAIDPQTGVFTWTPTAEQGPGTYSLDVTVSDGALSDVETIIITVSDPPPNEPPAVTSLALDDASIDENGSVLLSGLVTDADSADTHAVTIDWGDGSAPQVAPVDAQTRTFSASHQYLDDNPTSTPSDNYLILASAADNHAGTSPDESIALTVTNLAPAINPIGGPSFGVQSQSLAFTGSFTDVGSDDTHAASWQAIDGSNVVVASGTGSSFNFIPAAGGFYTIQFNVLDDDSGTTTVSKSIEVASAQLIPDPEQVGITILMIDGTSGNDTFTLSPTANAGEYSLNLNGVVLGPYSPTSSVQINGGGGVNAMILNGNSSVNTFEVHSDCLMLNTMAFFDHDIATRNINALGSGDVITVLGGSVTINGGAASDILVAAGPGSHAWLISSLNMGSLDGLVFFSHVEQLVGGSDTDTFQFVGGGRISGSIQGGGGSDVLIAADFDNTWVIDSAHGGTVKNTSFSGFETLLGGNADDTFRIVQGVTFAGELDGAGGADKLNYSAYTSAVEVNLDLGTATGVSGVSGIEDLTGGNGDDFLVGSAAANDISGGNGEDIILGWSGIDTLSGNAGSDLVVGGSGGDTLHGNNMDDILVGGKLAYADESNSIDRDSLEAILSIWLTQVAYSTRTANLRGGLLNSSAVLEDNAIDDLYGDGGADWFLTGVGDVVKPGKGEDTN